MTEVPPTAVEFAVRCTPNGHVQYLDPTSDHGDPTLTEQARRETAARVERYRDCWPDAVVVQRTVQYGQWTTNEETR